MNSTQAPNPCTLLAEMPREVQAAMQAVWHAAQAALSAMPASPSPASANAEAPTVPTVPENEPEGQAITMLQEMLDSARQANILLLNQMADKERELTKREEQIRSLQTDFGNRFTLLQNSAKQSSRLISTLERANRQLENECNTLRAQVADFENQAGN